MSRNRTVVSIVVALVVAGCAATPKDNPTLYSRLGGEPVVRRVVTETIDRAAADPRTSRSFKDVKLQRVKDMIHDQICDLAGGGCPYKGDSMEKVHKGLKNTEAEMNIVVQFLRDACDRAGVRPAEKNELLRLLAPMKRDIVTQ
ncbi:MAG TPA: group 1 truncated hemoglobin [Usitatibacter sp.]|nr:group 1 truncated hemoglobin [Usitatibacter sp.]